MDEGDSQPMIKAEPVEDNVGDSANVTQEKTASSGSEGSSDGFVKLEELEDAQPASPEAVEDLPTQNDAEDFTNPTPSTDISKEEQKEMTEEIVETSQTAENGLDEDAVGANLVDVAETAQQKVDSVEEVEKPATPVLATKEEEVVEPCKLYSVLPTSIEKVTDLLYWRDVKASAVAFCLVMLILLSLNHTSALLVFSHISISLLTVTALVRMYHFVMQTVNGTQQPNPFQALMELDLTISNETAQKYLDIFLTKFNCCVSTARDVFLFKKLAESLKFAVFSWIVGYVGSCFNGLTLITVAVALAFTAPIVYEKNKVQIDQYLGMAQAKVSSLVNQVRNTVPGLKPKVE